MVQPAKAAAVQAWRPKSHPQNSPKGELSFDLWPPLTRCMCFPPDQTLNILNTIFGGEKCLALEAKGKGHLQLCGEGGCLSF